MKFSFSNIFSYLSIRTKFTVRYSIKHPNTIPIPTPAPASPIVANPAPRIFDDCNIMKTLKLNCKIISINPINLLIYIRLKF